MEDTTLRLRARLTILEEATVRLFTVLGADHTSEVKAVVENFGQVFQNARGSELFGADLTADDRGNLFNMTTNEWPWVRAQILDPLGYLLCGIQVVTEHLKAKGHLK